MLDGIHLTLLIGPLPVPMPAPLPLMEALQSVQVNSGTRPQRLSVDVHREQDVAHPDRAAARRAA